jgi:Protein of unknown function (DUF3037)
MTDKKPYTYTVLRYVHDVNTGEFVNVGVVVHAPDARFVGAKLRHTHGRLSAMFPDLDRDAFRSSMRVIERALKSVAADYAKGDLFRVESDAAGIARSVLPAQVSRPILSNFSTGCSCVSLLASMISPSATSEVMTMCGGQSATNLTLRRSG